MVAFGDVGKQRYNAVGLMMKRTLTLAILAALASVSMGQRILTGANPSSSIFRSNDKNGVCVLALIPFAGSGGVRVATGHNLGGVQDGMTDYILGQGVGGTGRVIVYNGGTNTIIHNFTAFTGFSGGVHVAGGDVNGDGVTDILVAGEGADSPVKVFNGTDLSVLHSFFALPGFSGGVRVASGDVNNDGFDDVIIANGPGMGPRVNVYNGQTGAGIHSFFAYDSGFQGGVTVASGDVNGDGFDDIITGPGPGMAPEVKIFSGTNLSSLGTINHDPAVDTGVSVSYLADAEAVGIVQVLIGGGGKVSVYDGDTLEWRNDFLPEGQIYEGGVWVASDSDVVEPDWSLALNKTVVNGQNSVAGSLYLTTPKSTGTTFTTYDNSSLVNTPPTVTILPGLSHRVFQITTTAINSTINTTVYARLGAVTKSRPLTLGPLVPTAIAFNPVQIQGGQSSQGRIVINGVAGPGGRTISVVENSPYVDCPKSVVVPPGATDVFFNITTTTVPRQQNVLFRAIVSAGQTSATLRVTQ